MSRESEVCSLSNSELSVEIAPSEGGRISSLRSVGTGMEFLTQSHRRGRFRQPGLDARFQDGFCAGIEECLPTVRLSGPETDGGPVPDHGDFWQLPWEVFNLSDTSASMYAVGFSRPLRCSKKLTLHHNTLRVEYKLENAGSTAQSFLYACHPLFTVSAGDRVLLPNEIRKLTLDYSKGDRLGTSGSAIAWPVTETGVRLDLVLGPEAGTADMLYSSRLNHTVCGILREGSSQLLEVSFDSQRLPYLGVWLCYGGWPNDDEEPQQYAVALEPTTSPNNNLANAQRAGTAISLNRGETYNWEILFGVRKARALRSEEDKSLPG